MTVFFLRVLRFSAWDRPVAVRCAHQRPVRWPL